MTRVRLTAGLVFASGLLALAAGCGGSHAPANVSGSVKYKGTTLPGGTITFYGPDEARFARGIDKDGRYSIKDMPAGEYKVCVETESLNRKEEDYKGGFGGAPGTGDGGMTDMYKKAAAPSKKKAEPKQKKGPAAAESPRPEGAGEDVVLEYVQIPLKYGKPSETPLKATLGRGEATKDFDLTD